MILINDFTRHQLPVVAAYQGLLPIPAPVRGTTVSAAGLGTAVNVTTDMGSVALNERVRVWQGFDGIELSQPAVSLKKRHGATRGRPPREPSSGL